MIAKIDVPQSGWKVTQLGAPLIAIAKAINGLRKLQFKESTKWDFKWEEGGAVIEYVPGGGGSTAAPVTYPWQPYASPYLGSGNPPANQGLKIRVRQGFVYGLSGIRFPSNKNIEIVVPANSFGYYVWLIATLEPATGNLTALSLGHGTDLPTQNAPDYATGLLPATVYLPLFFVTSTASAVDDFSNLFVRGPLKLMPVQVTYTGTTAVRAMDWKVLSDESYTLSSLLELPYPQTP